MAGVKSGHDGIGVIARSQRSRECAPDDRLRDEAIHTVFAARWIASRFARNDG